MKQRAIHPDEYCYAIDDGKTMHCWDVKKKSRGNAHRKAAGTSKAKALLKRLGL